MKRWPTEPVAPKTPSKVVRQWLAIIFFCKSLMRHTALPFRKISVVGSEVLDIHFARHDLRFCGEIFMFVFLF
jgi:hypothetical protein